MKTLLTAFLIAILISACDSNESSTEHHVTKIDTSQPIYTAQISSDYGAMVCPIDALLDQRVGHGFSALIEAKLSVLNHQEKIAAVGCEELKGGIELSFDAEALKRIDELQEKGEVGFVMIQNLLGGKIAFTGDLTNNPQGVK